MTKMGMVNWGVGRKIAPTGMNTASVSTWDMFDSLENLMKYIQNYFVEELQKLNWLTRMILWKQVWKCLFRPQGKDYNQ